MICLIINNILLTCRKINVLVGATKMQLPTLYFNFHVFRNLSLRFTNFRMQYRNHRQQIQSEIVHNAFYRTPNLVIKNYTNLLAKDKN